jgi:TalC/MipB family fructose-6-phosphate aldolase
MGLYVDCALIEEVARLRATFPVAGVTTNPSILLDAVERGQRLRDVDALRGLLQTGDGPVFAQPVADSADRLRADGERYLALDPARIVLKLPMTADGIAAGRALRTAGARIAYTAVSSLAQAWLAASAGADWVIPYFSRLRRAGVDPCERVKGIARLLAAQECGARLLVASVKSSADVVEAVSLGARDITARPEVIRDLIEDALTTEAVARFDADWRRMAETLASLEGAPVTDY